VGFPFCIPALVPGGDGRFRGCAQGRLRRLRCARRRIATHAARCREWSYGDACGCEGTTHGADWQMYRVEMGTGICGSSASRQETHTLTALRQGDGGPRWMRVERGAALWTAMVRSDLAIGTPGRTVSTPWRPARHRAPGPVYPICVSACCRVPAKVIDDARAIYTLSFFLPSFPHRSCRQTILTHHKQPPGPHVPSLPLFARHQHWG
jgi:hypothetical protein